MKPAVGNDNSAWSVTDTWLYRVSSILESIQRASSHQNVSMCSVNSANVIVMSALSW
ncbi:hypothetical protein D3C77_521730 [compost metagenome]